MTKTLLSSFRSQLEKSTSELFTTYIAKQSPLKRMVHDSASYVLAVVIFIISTIVIYILKLARGKLPEQFDSLEEFLIEMVPMQKVFSSYDLKN